MLNFVTVRRTLVGALLLAAVPALVQADAFDNLTEELIKLRGRVEELHADLEEKKAAHKSFMTGLSQQKAELDGGIRREELRMRQLKQALEKNRADASQAGAADDELAPVLRNAITVLRRNISHGLPFKSGERLAELDDIQNQMASGELPSAKAANRLWAFYQDELRLTSENGLYRQSIDLNGERMLADVVRLGMVMMYFRTNDGRYGTVGRAEDGGWHYRVFEKSAEGEQVAVLFDAMKKQIRSGYFELPNALAAAGESN